MSEPAAARQRESPEAIAMLALDFGRLMMESGASARHVDEITSQVAVAFGAERVDLRVGYASLSMTVGIGTESVTRMRRVGPLGVNQTLDESLREAAARLGGPEASIVEARSGLDRLVKESAPHAPWIVALGVGAACAAFGRLIGADWAGVLPILLAAMLGQRLRSQLAAQRINVFLVTAAVAFVSASVCGVVARIAGSSTVPVDMVAAVLLLVPGVPALNAQNDILGGHPTLGSARAVWVVVVLVFIAAGLWLAQGFSVGGR